MSPWRLTRIARRLNQGAVIAYPSDTIWGLGCNPFLQKAVQRIQRIKRRSRRKGLILLSSRLEYLRPFIDESAFEQFHNQLQSPTRRPTTWLIKANRYCPSWLTGNSDRIAVRLTHLPYIALLCDVMQTALVSTSANISGRSTARNSLQVHQHFRDSVDLIIEGFGSQSQQASEIRDLHSGHLVRS